MELTYGKANILMQITVFLISVNIAIAQSPDSSARLLQEPIRPIPLSIPLAPDKVALGQKLFEDPFLAHNNKQSCSQCHRLNDDGEDNLYRSKTNFETYDTINTPTIFNVVFNVRHTW